VGGLVVTPTNLRWRLVTEGYTNYLLPAVSIEDLPECCQRLVSKDGLLSFECPSCGAAWIAEQAKECA
jgi:hypothetical protein